MQKYILLFLTLIALQVKAQIPEDALRYSFYPQSGTARNLAVGGAMGSLGGDLNAVYVNPAGLGFYRTGEIVFSPAYLFNNNQSNFRENSSTANKSNHFNLGTTGLVMGYNGNFYNPNASNAIGIAISQTANFNNNIFYKGLNNYSSFSEQFSEEYVKKKYTLDDVLNTNTPSPYKVSPALYTYLIDTVTINNIYQVKGAPEYILDAGQALMQEMKQQTKGGITELALSFAHSDGNKWFVGGSFGIPIINYTSNTTFKESDTSNNTNNHFKSFEYTDDFSTRGAGINGKFGVIFRPKDYVRLGLAVHTPTLMSLRDTRYTSLSTQLENPTGNFSVSSDIFTEGQEGESRYGQTTPWRIVASGSYVFREVEDTRRQKGFLTADVEYVGHGGSRFSAKSNLGLTDLNDENYYKQLNQTIAEQYKGSFNFRVGGELKFNTFMTRAGFAYYSNPYKDPALKASHMLLSGGLGYRNKGMFIDVTYVHAINRDVSFPYRLEDKDNTFATLNNQRSNIMATVGFKF